MKGPRSLRAPADDDTDEPVAAVEAMITELGRLRQSTRDRALLGAYQAAIERLEALAYRLQAKPQRHVIGLPGTTVTPPAPAIEEPPQRRLPLGPVVIARKSRRR